MKHFNQLDLTGIFLQKESNRLIRLILLHIFKHQMESLNLIHDKKKNTNRLKRNNITSGRRGYYRKKYFYIINRFNYETSDKR